MKKYKTEPDPETGLLRIIALKNFTYIKKGQSGGLIEKEENLSQEGDCWVYGKARITENARVYGNAQVYGDAKVYGNAQVYGGTWVHDNAQIYGNAQVYGAAEVWENAKVYGDAKVEGFSWVRNNAKVYNRAWIGEYTRICENAEICGNVKLWPTTRTFITSSIKNDKDYIKLIINKEVYIIPLSSDSTKNIIDENIISIISIDEENYINNIKTIRQLYNSIK